MLKMFFLLHFKFQFKKNYFGIQVNFTHVSKLWTKFMFFQVIYFKSNKVQQKN